MLDYSEYFNRPQRPSTRIVEIGTLRLPSGRVYCCDPFLSREVSALEILVAPGTYEVGVCVAALPEWGQRVALARLVFSPSPVVEWREATYVINGERQSGFRVDAGLACFMDQTTRDLFVRVVNDFHATGPDSNYYDDVLASQFKQNADPSDPYDAGDWIMHSPGKGDDRNVAMFASGLGDGAYHAYWGVDAAGQPAMLVADFNLLPLEGDADPANETSVRA